MEGRGKLFKIVVTGPESTGKSVLTSQIAKALNAHHVPEYAREYVENLDHHYTYEDVEAIARVQQKQELEAEKHGGIVVFDTWLIITKIWFEVVYGHSPEWLVKHLQQSTIDLFLVCNTDLPWIPDPVRENGGAKRDELLAIYCSEIEKMGYTYHLISGIGNERTQNALRIVHSRC